MLDCHEVSFLHCSFIAKIIDHANTEHSLNDHLIFCIHFLFRNFWIFLSPYLLLFLCVPRNEELIYDEIQCFIVVIFNNRTDSP